MEKISPQGRAFTKLAQITKVHDQNWSGWKEDYCKSYEMDKYVEAEGRREKRRIDGSLASIPNFIGSSELSELWKKGQKLEDNIKGKKDSYFAMLTT